MNTVAVQPQSNPSTAIQHGNMNYFYRSV